jgi:hypothetical protein
MATVRALITFIDASLRFGAPLPPRTLREIRAALSDMAGSPYVDRGEAIPAGAAPEKAGYSPGKQPA